MLNPEIISKIETLIQQEYQLRFNVVTNRLEQLNTKNNCHIPVNDYQYNSILRGLNKRGLPCTMKELQQILESDFIAKVDPIRGYFEQLEEWNKETDYIECLARTVSTPNDEYWQKYFKKWIVGITASILEQKPNHTMLVFCGKQGLGKTSWLNALIPSSLSSYMYNGIINTRNKDTLIYLSECILIIMDELEILNKTQLGGLKQLITNPSIRLRRPYSRNAEDMLRRASFCASVNNKKFLVDKTGNRRFLCFETTHIDYQHNVDLDKVYAQAIYLLRDGFQYWLDAKAIKECNLNNVTFSKRSIEEELLLSCFTAKEGIHAEYYLETTEIRDTIAKSKNIPVDNIRLKSLGAALRKNDFIKLKVKGRQKYRLTPKEGVLI